MKQNPFPAYIVLAFLLYLMFDELRYLSTYIKNRKTGRIHKGELCGTIQQHDRSAIYHVKLDETTSQYSVKLKTSLLSNLIPRLMGRKFDVVLAEDGSFCMIKSVIPMLFSYGVLICGFILLFSYFFN